jgi:hypothetical protein
LAAYNSHHESATAGLKIKEKIMTAKNSTQIISEALVHHIDATGDLQKRVAINAGLEPNYFSMVKKGDRPSLSRVVGLKKAMPGLEEHDLTVAILTEMFAAKEPTEERRAAAEAAIINLFAYLSEPQPLEAEMIKLIDEVREEEGKVGLHMPQSLPPHLRAIVKAALKSAVQSEANAAYAAAHDDL